MRFLDEIQQRPWRENTTYALLFLFPVAALAVRHWLSGLFTLLCLLALFSMHGTRPALGREEKITLWAFAGLVGAFAVSNLANGWGTEQWSSFGVEVRYLFFIPLYLMVRRYPGAAPALLKGTLVGAIVLAGQALYEVFVLDAQRVEGVYGPLILGGLATLMAFFAVFAWRIFRDSPWRWLAPPAFLGAWFALGSSGSRGGYVAAFVLLLVASVLMRRTKVASTFIAGALVLAVTYLTSDTVSMRVDSAVGEVITYLSMENPAQHRGNLTSSGQRLEMWRAAWTIFTDNPLLGVGADNFSQHARALADAGLVHPSAAQHAHAHNAFLHVLATKGVLGFVFLLTVFAYPAYLFMSGLQRSRRTATLGLILIVGFVVLGLTEAAPVIKGNYVALYLVYLASFLSWHQRMMPAKEHVPNSVRRSIRVSAPWLG